MVCQVNASSMSQKRRRFLWIVFITVALTWIILITTYLRQFRPTVQSFNWTICESLFQGKYDLALQVQSGLVPNRRLNSCEAITTFSGHVPWISPEEYRYPLAFAISVFENPEQFAHFLRLIYRPQNVYCIHIDRKTGRSTTEQFENIAHCFGPNVFLIPVDQRVDVSWGYFSVLQSTLLCAEHLLNQTVVPNWKYMLNMNNKEIPLRTNWEMVSALKALNGSNLVESVPCPDLEQRKPKHKYTFKVSSITCQSFVNGVRPIHKNVFCRAARCVR
ncbi:Beta-1 3-galactosyl-O-glycosyl-glycoprotein beta-1 6-N-acetylglucosaminyltransferase 3 [Fasciola gigantica]|uniref:Beta-1 3-galactosyl-O-glycosyl-glycoprotein beta-1 6-N-acetylglucosaminyltransferase 3 n=1 Tax=Fasciola gigantica TaxID=46835 RepID=A0A504YHG8_FASGI|nr:Beta-1 3-galactosyl-O-glycosyl-glycoprotein beta-1 6-N-acetylglucosaminyltransferase 3 [Fasciola gigantica]